MVVEDHGGWHGGEEPADRGVSPGVAVNPGVLLEVRDDLARGKPRVAALLYELKGVEGRFVGVDLVPEKHKRVRQLLDRIVPEPHRRRVKGVHPEPTFVLLVAEGVGRLVWRRDAARAEDELDLIPVVRGPNHARRERRTRLRPDLLPVQAHLVPVRVSWLEARDVDEGVVVAPDAERGRGAPEHLDLAWGVRLDPHGRVGVTSVAQERS